MKRILLLAALLAFLPLTAQRYTNPVLHLDYPDRSVCSLWVKLEVKPDPVRGKVPDAVCTFSYSLDGRRYVRAGEAFTARPEMWIGAKFGFYCNRPAPKNDAGWMDINNLAVSF